MNVTDSFTYPIGGRPAIVIAAYNRPHSLFRLLTAVAAADYPIGDDTPLVISLDGGGGEEVEQVANDFEWKAGTKRVICHPKNLGLRKHILSCGDLTREYGSIILLEDDTVASPAFYKYSCAANSFYGEKENIAQVSLYAYEYSELDLARFHPLQDGHDAYFMQWASSRGQLWNLRQWNDFKIWYDEHADKDLSNVPVPPRVLRWPESSWKKYFQIYLVQSEKYVVYPYIGYSTNFGDTGENVVAGTLPAVQTPIALDAPRTFRWCPFDTSIVRYDCYLQPMKRLVDRIQPDLASYDYEVDLHGTRGLNTIRAKYLLSIRNCDEPLKAYAWNLFPFEMNVTLGEEGRDIFFGETNKFSLEVSSIKDMRLALWSGRLLNVPQSIKCAVIKLFYKHLCSRRG